MSQKDITWGIDDCRWVARLSRNTIFLVLQPSHCSPAAMRRGAVSQGCSLLPYGAALPAPGGAQQGMFYGAETIGLIFLCKSLSHPGKVQLGGSFPWPERWEEEGLRSTGRLVPFCSQHRESPGWTLPPSLPPSLRRGDTVPAAEQRWLVPCKEEPGWAEKKQQWAMSGVFPFFQNQSIKLVCWKWNSLVIFMGSYPKCETGWSAATKLKVRCRLGAC